VAASLTHLDAGARPAPTYFVDLALPFDIDADVETHDHVRMINLEGLSHLFADDARSGDSDVRAIVGQVQQIIRDEVAEMSAQRRARQVGPTVAALRSQARDTVDREFDRLSRRLGETVPQKVLDEARQALRRVATTILHTPTVRVKELTGTDAESIDYAAALTTLFDLDRTPTAAASAPQTAAAAAPTAAEPADAGAGPADLLASMGADVDGLMAMALSPQLEMTAAATTATPAAHVAPALVTSGTGGAGMTAQATASASVTAPATASAGSTTPAVATGSGAADGTAPVADHTLDVVEPQHPTGRTVRLGTRRSRLARSQSTAIAQELAQRTGWRVEIVEVVTEGDVNMTPLATFGGTGVFVSAVRSALLAGTIDIAVHSLKDLPTAPAPGILLAAVPPRVDPADVLVARDGLTLAQLPAGAVVGTGSPRRAVQLRAARPDIEVTGVRGNVDTRIRHVTEGRLDGVVLAAAGVRRLGRIDEATDVLDGDVMLPAPGQGALAIECRAEDAHLGPDDATLIDALAGLHDAPTALAVGCERAILSSAEAGCSAPIGALAHVDGNTLEVTGVLADDAGTLLRQTRTAQLPDDPADAHRVALETGAAAATALLDGLGVAPGTAGGAHAPATHLPAASGRPHPAGGHDRDDSR
jgi:hydroxymethylbilane synthase